MIQVLTLALLLFPKSSYMSSDSSFSESDTISLSFFSLSFAFTPTNGFLL